MKDNIENTIHILVRMCEILSYELMMRSNDSAENWYSGAYKKAVLELYLEGGEHNERK